MGEQKDYHDTKDHLKYPVGEEDIFHLFDFFQTQFQPDRKHQKNDSEFPDKIERIVGGAVESEKCTDDRPCCDIADDMRYPEAFKDDVEHRRDGNG